MISPIVSIQKLSHSFGARTVLHDLSLDIDSGEYVVLLGPSGSGKTTLLSILGGFVDPTSGHVLIDGRDCTHMPPAKRPTTTVFQDYGLFPHMSIRANVAFGPRMNGVTRVKRERLARETLDLVGLEHSYDQKPDQLSGGQKQRVALARALIMKPKLLLLDEPLGALDLSLRRQMQSELKSIQKQTGTTFVHVTHDQDEAMALADLLLVMHDGHLVDKGSPERVYASPATRFSATFMGDNNLVEADVVAINDRVVTVETSIGTWDMETPQAHSGKSAVIIRPEDLGIEPWDARSVSLGPGTITANTFQGSYRKLLVHTDSGQKMILSMSNVQLPASVGERIELYADPCRMVLLQDRKTEHL